MSEWTPCDKGMPEDFLPVLVTVKSKIPQASWVKEKKYDYWVDIDRWDEEDKQWWAHDNKEVIAWMPRPEPWNEPRQTSLFE